MKKIISVVLSVVLLFSITPFALAAVPSVSCVTPCATPKCTHKIHIRITENTTQYVYENETVHLVQEVFTSVCRQCNKDEQTVIDSQFAELHTWVLEYENCDRVTGMHEYIYRCACGTNSFSVRCTGKHAIIANADDDATEIE